MLILDQPATSNSALITVTLNTRNRGPGVVSGCSRNWYQEYFLGGKGGRFIGLTTLLLWCANCPDVWEPQPLGNFRAWKLTSSLCLSLSLSIYIYIYIYMYYNLKVKWSRYRPGVAQRVGRGIALLFHDRGTRRGWVVSSTPWPHFTPGKDKVPILQEAGWAPGQVWTGEKSPPNRDSIPDRSARIQSLYRLSYQAHIY